MVGFRRWLVLGALSGYAMGAAFLLASGWSVVEYFEFRDSPIVSASIVDQNIANDGRVDSVWVRMEDGNLRLLSNLDRVPKETMAVGGNIGVRASGGKVVLADVGRILISALVFGCVAVVLACLSTVQTLVRRRLDRRSS